MTDRRAKACAILLILAGAAVQVAWGG